MKYLLILSLSLFSFTWSCSGEEDGKGNGEGVAEDISAEEMAKILNKEGIIILDVRTPGETAQGMIPGAIEIDFNGGDFKNEVKKLDKDKPVYIYCARGGRSKNAQEIMSGIGFKETYNLLGGYTEWYDKGLPTK